MCFTYITRKLLLLDALFILPPVFHFAFSPSWKWSVECWSETRGCAVVPHLVALNIPHRDMFYLIIISIIQGRGQAALNKYSVSKRGRSKEVSGTL